MSRKSCEGRECCNNQSEYYQLLANIFSIPFFKHQKDMSLPVAFFSQRRRLAKHLLMYFASAQCYPPLEKVWLSVSGIPFKLVFKNQLHIKFFMRTFLFNNQNYTFCTQQIHIGYWDCGI